LNEGGEAMGLYDFTFYDVVNRNAVTFKDKQAWFESEGERSLTFAEFKALVDRLATGLQEQGVRKGDRIGVLSKNNLEYFLLYGAAAALGVIVLPVNWRLSADEVWFNLNDGSPKLAFADKEYQGLIKGIKDKLPSVQAYYGLGTGGDGFVDFSSLLASAGGFKPASVAIDDGFVIIHTAAVAGRPRGALLSHGNVLFADIHFDYFMNITHRDVHLSFLPFFHVGGLFMATTAFHAGALNVNLSKFEAGRALELIQKKGVTFMMVFSPILATVVEEGQKRGIDISCLRAVTGIDTPETIEKHQRSTGGCFYSMYGQTETSCLATSAPYRDKPGSAGRVLPLVELRLVDDYDRPVPTGQEGEITVRGPMVFKGYWNLPEETAYTFREGWHHTGDQGRFDQEGFLWYAGRKAEKELIKPGGENVYPAEVEKAILQHPAVEKVVVFGVPDPKWKEGIKAVCQLKEGQTLDPQALIDFVGEHIARFKKPQYVEFVFPLPLKEDGSPDRAKIKEQYGGQA
jgi:acyl-CoA synthetase (AMP-forming)/AMP-acid ligase II